LNNVLKISKIGSFQGTSEKRQRGSQLKAKIGEETEFLRNK